MDIFHKLQFTQEWIELGIITPERLANIENEWHSSDDRHPEHYRWRAFLHFVKSNSLLDETTIKRLYSLGASDADKAMGWAMMAHLLRRNDCPRDLLHQAANSEEKFLRRIAEETLGQ